MVRHARPRAKAAASQKAARGSQAPRSGKPAAGAGPGGEFGLPPSVTPSLPPVASFAELDLPRPLAAELAAQGLAVPFPIQAAVLPNALAGRDILGRGRTGSGKTLAFGLPLLARTAGLRAEAREPLGLVLVPTRELAQQVTEALAPYARALGLRQTTVVGGLPLPRQARALRDGAEIVIATPGRLHDLIERGDCALGRVRITVLDEADQMADMGFLPQIVRLLRQIPADGQRMLLSATLDGNVGRLTREFLRDPVLHSVDPPAGAVTTMEHHLLHVAEDDKRVLVTRIAAREGRVILFCGTKRGAQRLTTRLLASGVRAAALHGGKSQPQRTRTLGQFKTGEVTVLVATNVAARGIHVDDLDLVVNVDPPADPKDYLHRGGRTARAGGSGRVVTLVLPEQRREVEKMMRDAGISPRSHRARPEDPELARLTGARAPSGVPVAIAAPAPAPAATATHRPPRRPGRPTRGTASASGAVRASLQGGGRRRRAR
ncbi:DEAD/DEAH box helicase [Streptomyces sp. DSM 44917]|uniref:DEAD/DEAH box helicase n=1 Tax=Streptomyces boetiae TaxID=3075541 RepID=A0ABU2LAB3_9ACTN|nr:DEAD/DEAH box helicase [Streptomyces sp. DSM 44917]MDT0308430.1 DEAD/DEAH box helicase [Streptomyces sp. DSM 44917]